MKKKGEAQAFIITGLNDIIDFIKTFNVRWVQTSFAKVDKFIKYKWIILLKAQDVKNILGAFEKCIPTPKTDNGIKFENNIMNQFFGLI